MKRHIPRAKNIRPTPLLDAMEMHDKRCGICEEPFTERDMEIGEVAEMFLPDAGGIRWSNSESKIVHAQCGLSHGWEIA